MDPHAGDEATPRPTSQPDPPPRSPALPDDPEALGRVLEAHRPYLWTVARRELQSDVGQETGASDVVQDTYLEAHRDLARFRGRSEGELKGWLRRILRNNLANLFRHYRGKGGHRPRNVSIDRDSADAVRDELTSPSPSPSGVAIRREEHDRFQLAMQQLRERDRQVLLWRSQEHCSWEEIGRRMGGNEVAARKAWSRAVHRLKEKLGGDPPPPGTVDTTGPA